MRLEKEADVGIFYIDTERNNTFNLDSISEAHQLMDEAEHDSTLRALVVTSTHKSLFSPGVDLPTLMGFSHTEMRCFVEELTGLVRRKFIYPKPEVYALNGHTIAGGFMMAATGEYRLMVDGPFKIGLMEIDIGLAAPIGVVQMLNFVFGGRVTGQILLSGQLFTPMEALDLGLIDEISDLGALMDRAIAMARLLGSKPSVGYQRLKRYLRQGVAERMRSLDEDHFDELVEHWFAEDTQERLESAVERLTKPKKAAV
jgi:enoyl-CoA hydratase/carnithine racemase